MGTKARLFTPVTALSLNELVPANHFYRLLDGVVDLTFVRELAHDYYAGTGRPSIDPVAFFKLHLVMFFEGIRSERQLLRLAADRLSVRWYLGYDLDEPLPDHASLTRIRARYGLEVFRRFFDAIVEQCQQAGLVWRQELYFDATQVQADASLDSLVPRFAVEAHAALQAHLDRVRDYHVGEPYAKAMRKRKVWVEPLFAEGKQWHRTRRFRLRRLWRVNCEALMLAAGQNLKRFLRAHGWGRRPLPSGAIACEQRDMEDLRLLLAGVPALADHRVRYDRCLAACRPVLAAGR